MSGTTITLKADGLRRLAKALKDSRFVVKVGVLKDQTRTKSEGTSGEGPTNAEIGAFHEFGTSTILQRSWLRMPLNEKLQKYLEDAGAFDKDAIKKIIDDRSLEDFMKLIGMTAETVIMDAFNSGGFGNWRPSNMKYKKNQQTLVETTQLRESISSEVIRDN